MAITYSWKIIGLKTKDEGPNKSAVIQTYWQKIGTDSHGNEGIFSGATPFSAADMDPEDFIPFEELTERTVIDWVKKVVVGSYEEHVNEQIQNQIDEKNSNLQEPGLPWKKPEEEPPQPE